MKALVPLLFCAGFLAAADRPEIRDDIDSKAQHFGDVSRKIWLTANFRVEYFGLVDNKIAANALFAAHGFRTTPSLALSALVLIDFSTL